MIKKIYLKNFKCFGEVEFDLPNQNGLYLITGNNEHQKALGSNGIGKSTLFDAILWCIYGKSATNRKAGKLLNRKQKNTGGYSVSLEFENGAKLERAWNPNSLKLDGVEVTQEPIDKFIRLTFDQFLQTIYFAQRQTNSFIDLTAGDKLNFLSQIFELEKWIKCADYAKATAQQIGVNRSSLLQKQVSIASLTQSSIEDLSRLDIQKMAWEASKLKEIELKEEQLKVVCREIHDIQPEDNSKLLEDLILCIKETEQELAKAKELRQEAANLSNENSTLIRVAQSKITTHKAEIVRLQNTPENCPTCMQKLPKNDAFSIRLGELNGFIATLEGDCKMLHEKLEKCQEAVKKEDAEEKKRSDQLQMYKDAKIDLYNKERIVEEKQKMVDSLTKDIDAKKKEENPYTNQITAIEIKIVEATQELDVIAEKITELDTEIANYGFWQKTFPAIRLKILNNVIEELEFHFNQALSSIGLLDWQIKLETERELKNETVKPELVLKLIQNDEEIDIEDLSGGEKQRIRLIVSLGLSTLIKNRAGLVSNLLLVDEPMQAVSKEGIELILELLVTLGQNNVVLVAEHRILELAKFAGVYSITKSKDGNSTISCSNQSATLPDKLLVS